MSKLKRKQMMLDLSDGRSSSNGINDYGTINVAKISNSDKLEDAFHKLELVIDKLAPETPPRLDSNDISLNAYNFSTNPTGFTSSGLIANGATTPESASNIFREANTYNFRLQGRPSGQPVSNEGFVYDGDDGILSATLDTETAEIVFTDQDDSGSATSPNGSLILTVPNEKDYFDGVVGKEGFWTAFTANVQLDPSENPNLIPSESPYTLELAHSLTGDRSIEFNIDNQQNPSLSSLSATGNMTSRVSGVPSYNTTDEITANFTVENAVKLFYRENVLSVTGTGIVSENYFLDTTPNQNATITDSLILNPQDNVFRDSSIVLTYIGKDVFNNQTESTLTLSNKRVDTKSIIVADNDDNIDAGRYKASGNDAVSSGGSGNTLNSYDHSQSLKNSTLGYHTQLQVHNGLYKYPVSTNYSSYDFFDGLSNNPGPDYSTGISEAKRWASFNYNLQTTQSLTQQVNIAINNNTGITTSNQNGGSADLYYKVITWNGSFGGTIEQETVWIQAIGNVNSATFDNGDPFMVGTGSNDETTVYSDNTSGAHIGTINQNNRVLTVGNNINGNGKNVSVHVRIGIQNGQNYSFSGVSVSL